MKKLFVLSLLAFFAIRVSAQTTAETEVDKKGKAQLVDRLMNSRSYLYSQILDKCFSFRLSPSCWSTFSDPANDGQTSGYEASVYWIGSAIMFAKNEGLGDLTLLNVSGNPAEEKSNRPQMDAIVDKLRQKFSMTIEAPVDCTKKTSELITRSSREVTHIISEDRWSPKSGEAHFRVVLSPTAKDVSVKISTDGKQFTVTGPASTEAYETPRKVAEGLASANKNR